MIAGPTLAVATGPRCYVPGGIELAAGRRRLWVACRAHPEVSYTDVELATYTLDGAPLLQAAERWDGWRPFAVGEPWPAARPSIKEGGQTSTAPGRSPGAACDARPSIGEGGKTYRLYWADLHVHTALSADAAGHVDEIIAYARDKARLDCLAISDNDRSHLSLTASDWETYRHYVRHFHQDGRFVLLPAYEWTYRPDPRGAPNHRTVLGVDERLPILRHHEAGHDPMRALAAHAARHDLLLHVHHEQWQLTDPPSEANFEICSGWGSHMANPFHRRRYHDALAAGRRLGFAGNSDNHRRNPGLGGALTGIYAEALTRQAILEALRSRRCFATDGSRIVLRLWADGTFMGGEVATANAPRLRWDVAVPAPPGTVTLIRGGEAIQVWQTERTTMAGEYVDAACPRGDHYYYLAVEQSSPWQECPSNVAVAWGPHAWSSPVWVRRTT